MNPILEKVVKVPVATKIGVAVGAMLAITAANWLLLINDLDGKIAASTASLGKLEKDLVDKKVIADNLNQYKRDKEILERRLAEALTELPADRDIDELLRQLNDVGKKSGLKIVSLEPTAESVQDFYASIPLRMQVAGTYHEIAVFFESISKLRRIVNVSNITFSNAKSSGDKVVLNAQFLATTFRFVDEAEQAALRDGKGKGKARRKR